MERFCVGFRIAPVLGEQAYGPFGLRFDCKFAFRAIWQFVAVLVDDGHVVAGRSDAHRAWPVLHAGEGGGEQGRLSLTVALPDVESGALAPRIDHLGVDRLACTDRVSQGLWLEFGQVLQNHHAVDGGRGEECRYGESFEDVHSLAGAEPAALVPNEDCCAHIPGRIEAGP